MLNYRKNMQINEIMSQKGPEFWRRNTKRIVKDNKVNKLCIWNEFFITGIYLRTSNTFSENYEYFKVPGPQIKEFL